MAEFLVATLNARKSNAESVAAARHMVAQTFEKCGMPFVVALQEMDIDAPRSGQVNAPRQIAGKNSVFFSQSVAFDSAAKEVTVLTAPRPQSVRVKEPVWEYGLALVSSARFLVTETVALGPMDPAYGRNPTRGCHEPRIVQVAGVGTGLRHNLFVMNTHLAPSKDREQSSTQRQAQIERLVDRVDRFLPDVPLVLTGDFNATLDNPDLKPLLARFSAAAVLDTTFSGSMPDDLAAACRIDHVFYRNCTIKQCHTRVLAGSDHKAVIAEFAL